MASHIGNLLLPQHSARCSLPPAACATRPCSQLWGCLPGWQQGRSSAACRGNLPPAAPCRAHAAVGRCRAVAAEQLDTWDVVEFTEQQPPRLRLGLVQQVGTDAVAVSPLIEEDEGVWVPESDDAEAPEQQQQVPLSRVLRVVESVYGQRQDKDHNPHGEHAHDCWQVFVPLSPGIIRGSGDEGGKS